MDFRFTPEEEAYRDEVRRFIDDEMPEELALAGAQGEAADPGLAEQVRALRMKIGARGWIAMSWPKEYGGQDRPLTYQAILREEMSYARCPGIDPQAYQLGPALIVHGTEAQKREHIGRIASGESRWCQGFSEPNAGSDLRLPPDPRRAGRRRLRHQRPEDLDVQRPQRRPHPPPRPHRPRRPQAPRHLLLPLLYEVARRHRQANPPDGQRPRLQRGLLRQRPCPPRRPLRRATPRLVRRHHDPRLRALQRRRAGGLPPRLRRPHGLPHRRLLRPER